MFLAVDGALAGAIAVGDPIKDSTPARSTALRADGLRIVMLTGDARGTAQAVAAHSRHRRSDRRSATGGQGEDRRATAIGRTARRHGGRRHQRCTGAGARRRRHRDGDRHGHRDGERAGHPGEGRSQRHRKGARIEPRDGAQHPAEPRDSPSATTRSAFRLPRECCIQLTGSLLSPMLAALAMSLSSISVITNALRLPGENSTMVTRRRFVEGMGAGAVAVRPAAGRCSARRRPPPSSIGPDFDLTIDELPVNLTGAARTRRRGQRPDPGADAAHAPGRRSHDPRHQQAARAALRFTGTVSSCPPDMDGVPGLSFDGIAPGTTFTYRFKVNQSGTYWYHSHSRFQEQVGSVRRARRRAARRRAPRGRPRARAAAVRLDRSRSRTHLRHAQAPERLLQLRQTHRGEFRATTCARAASRTRSPTGACGARCAWTPRIWPTSAAMRTPI